MTEIGDLKHFVRIERKVRGPDDGQGGSLSESWTPVADVWAHMENGSGKEITLADQVSHRVDWKFTMRRRADITGAMRIVYNGRTFAIIGAPIFPKQENWMTLQCEEGTAYEQAPS